MSSFLSEEQILQRIPTVIEQMKERTAPHLMAVYGVFDEQFGELIGSGTLVTAFGTPVLLTALHNLELESTLRSKGYQHLAHSVRSGEAPSPLHGPFFGSRDERILDIGVAPLDPRIVATGDRIPTHVGDSSFGCEDDALFIHGFPGKKSSPYFGVHSTSYPYLSGSTTSQYDWFDPTKHIAIDFPADCLLDEGGNHTDFVDPHGLSGSGLWRTGWNLSDDAWTASRASLVGVIHNWDKKGQALIATRIEHVRELLLRQARCRRAAENWNARNQPDGDDWHDWFEAVKEFPLLSP